MEEIVSAESSQPVKEKILAEGFQSAHWRFSGLTERDYVFNSAGISFFNNSTFKKAIYDEDFEDIRRRVPDLSRLRATIDYQPSYDLAAIIRELIAAHGASPGESS